MKLQNEVSLAEKIANMSQVILLCLVPWSGLLSILRDFICDGTGSQMETTIVC